MNNQLNKGQSTSISLDTYVDSETVLNSYGEWIQPSEKHAQ